MHTLTGLRPATTYYFAVRAYGADPRLYSEFSNQVSAVVTQVSAPPVVAPEPRSTPRAGPAPGAAAEGAVLPRSFKGQPNRGVLIIDGVRWKAPPPPGP